MQQGLCFPAASITNHNMHVRKLSKALSTHDILLVHILAPTANV